MRIHFGEPVSRAGIKQGTVIGGYEMQELRRSSNARFILVSTELITLSRRRRFLRSRIITQLLTLREQLAALSDRPRNAL
jgi:hypothetical protein